MSTVIVVDSRMIGYVVKLLCAGECVSGGEKGTRDQAHTTLHIHKSQVKETRNERMIH